MDIGELIELTAISMGLPPDDPSTSDRIIELLAVSAIQSGGAFGSGDTDLLQKITSARQYKGGNPHVMLSLYDILGGESDESLQYGIQGFEAFGRDPERIAAREKPYRLAEYAVATAEATADGLEELVKLKDALLHKGGFYRSGES